MMTNAHHTALYTGVTNDLRRRTLEHKAGTGSGFSKKYNLTKLVFFECGDDIRVAIAREKQLKGGSRRKKMDLVNSLNPEWKDLFEELFMYVAVSCHPSFHECHCEDRRDEAISSPWEQKIASLRSQ